MKRILLFTLLLIPIFCLAQSNYHKGSVVLSDGTVMSGYINYREWEKNPTTVEYKATPDDKSAQSFAPGDIQSFTIDGLEKYLTFAGRISLNKTQFPDFSIGIDTNKRYSVILLKQVVTGNNVTLYLHADDLKTRIFIQEKDKQPVELAYQEYYNNNKDQTFTQSRFKAQLLDLANTYAPANTKLKRQIEVTRYAVSDLQNIANKINGVDAKTASINRLPNYSFFAGAGLNIANTGYNNVEGIRGVISGSSTSYAPKVAAGIDIFTNPNVKRIIIRGELAFSYLDANINISDASISSSQPYITTRTFKQYTTSLTPQVIWNVYNKDDFKFYLDAGIGLNYSTYTNNKLSSTEPYLNVTSYDLEAFWFSFPVQTGVVVNKHVELFASYSFATHYTNYLGSSASSALYGAGVHYLFGKAVK